MFRCGPIPRFSHRFHTMSPKWGLVYKAVVGTVLLKSTAVPVLGTFE